MRKCNYCQIQMEEGYMLKSNTYGTLKIVRGVPKTDGINIAICPTCGEISMYLHNPHK